MTSITGLENRTSVPVLLPVSESKKEDEVPAESILPRQLAGKYQNIGYSKLPPLRIPPDVSSDGQLEIEVFAPTASAGGNRLPISGIHNIHKFDELEMKLTAQQKETLVTRAGDQLTPIKKMPTIIFSPGCNAEPVEYRHILEDFASHGFTVVVLRHPSNYPPESFFEDKNDTKKWDRMAETEADHIRYVMTQIRNGNLLNDVALPDQIIVAGHSIGGAASVLVARADPSVAGCINIDGNLRSDRKAEGIEVPVLTILANWLRDEDLVPEEEKADFEKFKNDFHDHWVKEWNSFHADSEHSQLVNIKEVLHGSFCLNDLLWVLTGEKVEVPIAEAAKIAHQKTIEAFQQFIGTLALLKQN